MALELKKDSSNQNPLRLDNPEATKRIVSLSEKLVKEQQYGRYPLFVIGAGVSGAAGIPLMNDFLTTLESITKADPLLKKIHDLCMQSQRVRTRSNIAILFGELQEASPDTTEGKLWTRFCEKFISGSIPTSGYSGKEKSILSRDATKTHKWIAKMCIEYGSRCLSLNFDGLTRTAINQGLEGKGRCVILDSAEKIRSFFGRVPKKSEVLDLYSVIKLRGDIFYAICKTSGCPLGEPLNKTPIYALPFLDREQEKEKGTEKLIACPECGKPRSLQIVFPGFYIKEQESEEMIDELWRYVAPNLSMIFALGLSGEWDRSVVDFVFKVAQCQQISVIDVRLPPESYSNHYIRDIWREHYPNAEYHAFYGEADKFSEIIQQEIEKINSKPFVVPKEGLKPEPWKIPGDDIWEKSENTSGEIAAGICNLHSASKLKFYSQLGLKTFWWGAVKEFARHNRYNHSIGAMRVARKWYEHLRDSRRLKNCNYGKELEFLCIGTLLHDYGHLPFSHLFEEIFEELHWVPLENPSRPWHENLTRQKIERLFDEKLPGSEMIVNKHVEEIGYDLDRVMALIDGRTGKAYLDAIVNSPIDSDKIDYIFRDLHFLKLGSSLPLIPDDWMEDFLADQDLSGEGLIRLNGLSALRMLELLETRRNLYLKFYLSPELRMMERITIHILVCYYSHYISEAMLDNIKKEKEPLKADHGTMKAALASKDILKEYSDILLGGGDKDRKLELQENYLLDKLLDKMINSTYRMDTGVMESLKKLKGHLSVFPRDQDSSHFGKDLKDLYKKLHVAGPYYVAESKEEELRNKVVRDLMLIHQGSVLFDVVKTPKFLAGSKSREFGRLGKIPRKLVGETFLVPSVNPNKWTVKSPAQVPLYEVNFGQLEDRHLQVLIFDPLEEPSKSRYVHQQFLKRCNESGISLLENPIILKGG